MRHWSVRFADEMALDEFFDRSAAGRSAARIQERSGGGSTLSVSGIGGTSADASMERSSETSKPGRDAEFRR